MKSGMAKKKLINRRKAKPTLSKRTSSIVRRKPVTAKMVPKKKKPP